MTQRDVILDALKSAGERGICLSDVALIDPTLTYRMRNYVSEMRRFDHLPIESEPCKAHRHRSSVARYHLVTKPVQLEIPA